MNFVVWFTVAYFSRNINNYLYQWFHHVDLCLDGSIVDEWLIGWVDEWLNVWVDEWLNVWVDEWLIDWLGG